MCTCGIAIATQQAIAAIASSPCKVLGLRPSVPWCPPVAPISTCSTGERRRSNNASGTIVTRQKIAMPRCVARQPLVSMKCWMIGGHTAPER